MSPGQDGKALPHNNVMVCRGSGGAGRERTAPSLEDAASSEGLGRGDGGVGLDLTSFGQRSIVGWVGPGQRRSWTEKDCPKPEQCSIVGGAGMKRCENWAGRNRLRAGDASPSDGLGGGDEGAGGDMITDARIAQSHRTG